MRCWACSSRRVAGTYSRYARYWWIPDPQVDEGGMIDRLLELARRVEGRPVIFTGCDPHAQALAKHRDTLDDRAMHRPRRGSSISWFTKEASVSGQRDTSEVTRNRYQRRSFRVKFLPSAPCETGSASSPAQLSSSRGRRVRRGAGDAARPRPSVRGAGLFFLVISLCAVGGAIAAWHIRHSRFAEGVPAPIPTLGQVIVRSVGCRRS